MKYYTYSGNLNDRNPYTSSVNVNNFGRKRYFSSLDSEVYFGERQIDDIVAIDFTVAEPKLPIYGYNSFYPNRIVSGRRTVQGTFAINFTNTLSLVDLLYNISDSVLANDYEAFTYRCPEEDSTGLGIGNSPIFEKMFDITISYGYGYNNPDPTLNACYQTIVGVQIVDYRQALDTEGNPILDMYSFIAKDIRYDRQLVQQKSESPDNTISGSSGITSSGSEGGGEEYIKIFENVVSAYDAPQLSGLLNVTNSDNATMGFIVYSSLSKNNGSYYITTKIDAQNCEEDFKNINISIIDSTQDIRIEYEWQTMDSSQKTFDANASLYKPSAEKIYKLYYEKKYKSYMNISFEAKIKQADGSYKWTLYEGKVLINIK